MGIFFSYLSLPFIYFFAFLPLPVLYKISDFLRFIIFNVISYRKKVVRENLKNSFPTLSAGDINRIEQMFFRHFCDLLVEGVKVLGMSQNQLRKRVEIKNVDVFKKYFEQNQSLMVAMGHQGNWEWAGVRFGLFNYHQLFAIYHPLKNKVFDGLVKKIRTKTGVRLYAMNETLRGMIENKGQVTATAFIADQTPSPKNAHWLNFLNQETPVFPGIAKISKKMNYPLVFASVSKKKRGYYTVDLELLIENPAEYSEEEISKKHTERLEKDIIKNPHLWLWTHRRWKHKKQANY